MKLTEWFPADVNPVRKGRYQYRYEHGYEFPADWNGKNWEVMELGFYGDRILPLEGDSWRGLAEKPF